MPTTLQSGRTFGENNEKILALAALTLSIELVLFKFVPDIGTATVQRNTSVLTDFATYEAAYLTPHSVHHARFLGNYILYLLAKFLSTVYHSGDIRLHPLRVAAGILTPLYSYVGAHLAIIDRTYAWRHFLALYGLATLIGMYVFYPGDMSSLAFLSIALYFVLQERMLLALVFMLVTGLFRESAFHVVFFVVLWAWCARSRSIGNKVGWLLGFAVAFVVEYRIVRHFFPGPVASGGGIILDPRVIFLDRGTMSLTTLCSLGLAALFPIACFMKLRALGDGDWRSKFFLLNCYAFPAWVVFYRMMNGNLSEFRMLLPALLPCIYGLAFATARIAGRTSNVALSADER